ncbi:MAG TPA: antibiotic biosynthesis monooxygenase [Dongiaceae bacterium]|nr:antibiotic biosynthesis monooxygenase [Dongiaceae bacterium]
MELVIFARFHAREGRERALAVALRDQAARVRTEPGRLPIGVFEAVGNPRLFWIHSRWVDEAGFQVHADLPNTRRFIERVEELIDDPFDATRARALE